MTTLTTVIQDSHRGLLYRDGRLVRWLEPGRHRFWAWRAEFKVDMIDLDAGYSRSTPELRSVMPDGVGYEVVIAPEQVGVLLIDGKPVECLEAGRYILWQARATVSVELYDTTQVFADVPEEHVRLMPGGYLISYTVPETQRGVLTIDGKVAEWLDAGKHQLWCRHRNMSVRFIDLNAGFINIDVEPEVAGVIPRGATEPLEVARGELAILYREGRGFVCLAPGSYLVWQLRRKITFRVFSMRELMTEIPEDDWPLVGGHLMQQRTVSTYERGLVWVDGEFVAELEAGRYGVHCDRRDVRFVVLDMRERDLQIQGQEVMTSDKVTLRMNLVVKYRVVDARASVEAHMDLEDGLYSEAQLVARSYIAGVGVDALLEARGDASTYMLEHLRERAAAWGIEIMRIDLKDVILPGEMKTLLNRVIEAEKQAAANVIMRREETAATRAQANTAKMMENNPALMRLKELEMMREIATNVGNITIVAGAEDLAKFVSTKQLGD